MSENRGLGSFAIAMLCCVLGVAENEATDYYSSCLSGPISDIGNGRCDAALNVPSCGFDGGDCCPCTCSDGPSHSCSDNEFDCVYPDCDGSTSSFLWSSEGSIGNGFCDEFNNHVWDDWDGGDCCKCTCEENPDFACGAYSTKEDSDYTSSSFPDDSNPYLAYYDTRVVSVYTNDGEDIFFDGWHIRSGFDCQDPACFDPHTVVEFPDCTGSWMKIGDGTCSEENNNALCGYDGGDCCLCTCRGVACETSVFDCLDPSVDDEIFNCARPFVTLPCSDDVQHFWKVETSAQARALAAAVNCSGGSFEVEWRGSIVVDTPIHIADGTVLRLTGVAGASPAEMDGNASTQVFKIVNASLDISDIDITGGYATYGGAIDAAGSSLTVTRTNFILNVANSGGAVFLSGGSSMVGTTVAFKGNRVYDKGGAVCMSDRSRVYFAGQALFYNGMALKGGFLHATDSKASWDHAEFFNGGAMQAGGALYLVGSEVFWSGETLFERNSANEEGGAILIMNGSSMTLSGKTTFMENHAITDGGAIVSPASDTISNPLDSTLTISGETTFYKNTCNGNGAGLALFGACSIVITEAAGVNFTGNEAYTTGGALYVSSTGSGPTFSRVTFVSNSAQSGGAASITGSGNTKDTIDATPPDPTTFDHCEFINNGAHVAGGAVESAAGHDVFSNSIFKGNTAGVGGALRLAGTAFVSNCSFVENVSADGEGAAVSNIGSLSMGDGNSFHGNAFYCPRFMFLDFNESDPFEVVCNGCDYCFGCSFDNPPLVPMCSDVMEHANSSGGSVTLEELWIEPGYWRATETSTDILACYNARACLGGVTEAPGYCLEGHKGPYCSICSDGYSPQPGFKCTNCSNSIGGIVLASVLLAGGLLGLAAVISYLMSGEDPTRRQGFVQRLARYIPLQSVKVIIVAWQILTQFTSVANITYPDVYQRFLDFLDIINFDMGLQFSVGCMIEIDFYDRLLISTVCPMVVIVLLAWHYAVVALWSQLPPQILQIIWNKHVSMVLLVTFLVYSSVSSVLFKTFACEHLDDGQHYLRADYRIKCDSRKHKDFQVYACFMIVVYAIGIPALYVVLLFRDRGVWDLSEAGREKAAITSPTSDLWRPYKQSAHYYEVVECSRRVLLTGVVVFIYPNTAAQIAVTLMMAFAFVVISEVLRPYASRWDTWISRMGHIVVFVSMFVALLLKVDVSDERASSQKVFEFVLISVHVCMVAVVVVETFFVAASLRADHREEKKLSESRRSRTDSLEDDDVVFETSNPYPGLPRIFY